MANVYTKNFHLPSAGLIGGKEVTAEIDAELNAKLKVVGKKASDYHSEKPKPRAKKKE